MSKRKPSSLSDDSPDMGKSSNFDDLPKEILAEIMSRLPPKMLMRCKCLNKSWYFVIRCLVKNPDFVAKHLHHSEASPTTLLVSEHQRRLCNPPPGLPESFYNEVITSIIVAEFIENGDNSNIDCITEVVNLPRCLIKESFVFWEVYHCNGIICLTNDFETVTLYNPVLREFDTFHPETAVTGVISGMGLGSNSSASIFKIVRLSRPMKAEVFTPGSIIDSWREINISVRDEHYGIADDHVYFKGYCFWLMSGVERTVLCFNVCNEVFHSTPLPNELQLSEDSFSRLSVCDDSVCLFWNSRESIDMWVMDVDSDGGNRGHICCWRKRLRTKLFEGVDVPWTVWKSDELLTDTEDGEIVSYNLHTGKRRSLSLVEMLGYTFHWSPFVKSLVSIKGMRQG